MGLCRDGLVPAMSKPSNQEVATPREFLDAFEQRFGRIGFDLAANADNKVVPFFYGPGSDLGEDSLREDWTLVREGPLWLNPPFKTIAPWARKAAAESTHEPIAMLVPAAVCTGWFVEHVAPFAYVFELTPRVFSTQIRDCILAMFTPEGYVGRETWRWK